MSSYKNQHYVPQSYFKLFSKNKKTICLLNVKNNLFVENATIRGQCSKKFFYSKKSELEKNFSYLEDLGNKKIRTIIDSKSLSSLSNEQQHHLKSHILFQWGRTKTAKDKMTEMANNFFDQLKPDMYKNFLNEQKDISWDTIKNTKIIPKGHHSLFFSMMSGILLYDMEICLIENNTNTDFIFSDNPVVLFNSFFNDKHPLGTTGIASTGLQIFYPLSSRFMIFMYDPTYYEVKGNLRLTKNKDIQRLNCLQILKCDENVYFENKSMQTHVERRVKEVIKNKPKEKTTFQKLGSRIDEDGTYKELYHTSSPKIKYDLTKLSFLKHKVTDLPYGVRNIELKEFNRTIIDAVESGKIESIEDLDKFIEKLMPESNS